MREVVVRNVVKSFGDFVALKGVSLTAAAGEVTTLLGPSGCGKTTLLRCIAGLEDPDGGEILLGDQLVSNQDGSQVAADKRGLGMVFQSYAVWPHMNVFENVAYGLSLRKWKKDAVRARVAEVLELVGLEGREKHSPSDLSGGQQQRVVLARSLAYSPPILLLDEPLANLDAKLRERMRFELRQIQEETGVTAIYVTHDQSEAMAISHKIVVLSQGEIQQIGTPEEIYDRPINSYVAEFVGIANFMAVEGIVDLRHGQTVSVRSPIGVVVAADRPEVEEIGQLSVRPENFVITAVPQSSVNSWEGAIETSIYLGEYTRYSVRVGDQLIRVHGSGHRKFRAGDTVYLEVDPEQVVLLEGARSLTGSVR